MLLRYFESSRFLCISWISTDEIRSRTVPPTWAAGNFCFVDHSVCFTRLCFKFSFCYYFMFNCIVFSFVGNDDLFCLVLLRLHVPHYQFTVCFYFSFGSYCCFVYTLITHFQRYKQLSFLFMFNKGIVFFIFLSTISRVRQLLFQIKFESTPTIKHLPANTVTVVFDYYRRRIIIQQ